jgi:glycosyltransferase involved in cell wall biosynthesis
MRVLVVCPYPLAFELGAVQVHVNLATALREIGHDVTVWSPFPMRERHWAMVELEARAKLREYLRTARFDVVDCPPVLLSRDLIDRRTTWVARSVQPDILYIWEDVRARRVRSLTGALRTTAFASWMVGVAVLEYLGWTAAHRVMCFGSPERAWIAKHFPWLRPKLLSYDGALADPDRAALANVRRARVPRRSDALRYLWIGRWVPHKGIDALLRFVGERLSAGTEERFTIAGCGEKGERQLQGLAETGRVRVVRTFARSELPRLLAEHDAGLFTSRVEGWGLVLNEMVESGLPVYATDAGGAADIRSVLGSFVQEFPPRSGAPLPAIPSEETFSRYDARFSWRAIAKQYLEVVQPIRGAR